MKKSYGRKTIYLPEQLAKALEGHPEINFTRICQAALEAAVGLTPGPSDSGTTSTLTSELTKAESALRSSRGALEKIARLAAAQAGMIVLTEKEAETYNKILDISISQFVFRTRKEAVEEYKAEMEREAVRRRKRKAEKLTSSSSTETTLVATNTQSNQQPESEKPTARCVDCGDTADIACSKCNAPLCWTCWAGNDLEGPATELCRKCQQLLNGDQTAVVAINQQ